MENIYSVFYTGKPNPFGIGTWDSVAPKLKHSSSQPFISNQSKPLPPILSEQANGKNNFNNTQFSNKNKQNLKLPIIESRPGSNYRPKKAKRYRTKSSDESSYNYDENKNRKELSNFVKDINKSIAVRLQNDNFIAQQKLNNIKNNYNEIKTLLNNKIDKLEQDQQMQFDNLKLALEQSGGLKMMGAVKNANGGNNYDLKRAEEEDIIDATRKLPRLLEDKINIINDMKRKEKEDEKRLLSKVRQKVNEEIKKQKEKDEIRFKKEIDEIEQKRENIRQERVKLMEELQNQEMEESESESLTNPNPPPIYEPNGPSQGLPPTTMLPPQIPPIIQPYPPFLQNMYPPMNNNNNNSKDSTGELLKIFLFKKIFDDKPQPQSSPQIQPQYIPTPYPQPQYPPYPPPPQYQPPPPQPQQPITIPQPIIYQSPAPVVSPPNIIIQKENSPPQPQPQIQPQIIQPPVQYKDIVITKSETIKSEKGIPFVDPLENYLKETRPARIVRTKKKTTKKSTRKKTTVKEKTEEEEDEEEEEEEDDDSTPPPIKLKLYDPDNMENNKVINISNSKVKVSKNTKDSKATKKSSKKSSKKNTKKSTVKKETQPKESKEKKKTSSKKSSKPKEPEERKQEEEEEEYDEEEEEEEDDEEEEEEEDDEEGGPPEDDGNQRIIRKKK